MLEFLRGQEMVLDVKQNGCLQKEHVLHGLAVVYEFGAELDELGTADHLHDLLARDEPARPVIVLIDEPF
jgi:hypothetical protein